MNLFFKEMTAEQKKNSDKGMVVGFLSAMFLLLMNIFYDMSTDKTLLSSHTIFISIFVIALGYEWYLNKFKK